MAEAIQLISEGGSDSFKMSALAERSGVSIGSLYQHFPDKSAILAAIALRYHATTRECIEKALESALTWNDFVKGFTKLVTDYYSIFLSEPVIRDVWSGVAADKALQSLEVESARDSGTLLAKHLVRVLPDAHMERVNDAAFFVMALGESAMRLAMLCAPQEGVRHIESFTRLALFELSFAGGVSAGQA
ncbi:TetR/AcrR family transcriptional regulator [Tabrizicola piscis]|uniref:TetR/AcrR family transcriptional regulator n=1 Tax=Tabrizicola piscis TaxID=2494374 RepID=UPI0013DDA888|nr:TetR/AcrR family transcriptional regulator [Tabrizicola piscis]